MTHFIRDNTSPGDAKADYRVRAEVPSSQKITAADWETFRQALLDTQSFLRGADWLAVAAQSAAPVPSGVTNFLWLDNTGLIHLSRAGVDRVVAGSSPALSMAAGRYYFTPAGTTTTGAPANNSLRLVPFYVPQAIALTKIGAEVTTAGEAGSKFRIGIYADDGTGRPGSLALDAGQIAGDSVSVQELTVSVTIGPGWYWFGGAVQSAPTTPPTLRVSTLSMPNIDFGATTPGANMAAVGVAHSGVVSGALPSVFTFATTLGNSPRIFVKT